MADGSELDALLDEMEGLDTPSSTGAGSEPSSSGGISALDDILDEIDDGGELPEVQDSEPINEGDYRDLGPLDAAMAGGKKALSDIGGVILDPIGSAKRGIETAKAIPGAVADEFSKPGAFGQDGALETGVGMVGSGASTLAGAGLGAAAGSVVPVVGTALGGLAGAAAGYMGWDIVRNGLESLIDDTPEYKSTSQTIGEVSEMTTLGAIAAPLAAAGRTAAGRSVSKLKRNPDKRLGFEIEKGPEATEGRFGFQRAARSAVDQSKADRSIETQVKTLLQRQDSKHVAVEDLDKAGDLVGRELIETMSVGEPVTQRNVLRRMRDTIGSGGKDANGRWRWDEGTLLQKYGDEVSNYLSKSTETFNMQKASSLVDDALDDVVFSIGENQSRTSMKSQIEMALKKRFAEKAGYTKAQIGSGLAKKQADIKQLTSDLAPGKKMPYQQRQQKIARLNRLKQEVLDLDNDINSQQLSAAEFWEYTNDHLRSNKLDFSDLEKSGTPNRVLTNYRKRVQDKIAQGMGADEASYRAASQKYAAAKNVKDWAEDGINALESKQKGLDIPGLELKRQILQKALSWEQKMPEMVKHFYNAQDALYGGYSGTASRFRKLANLTANILPHKIGGSIHDAFRAETIGALKAAEMTANTFLSENPPTMEEQQVGDTTTEDFIAGISIAKQALQQGETADPMTRRRILSDLSTHPLGSKVLSLDAQTGLMEGVKAIGGEPLNGASLEKYLQNLDNSDMDNFEKTKRRTYFNKNGKFMEEPNPEEKLPDVDEEAIQKQIQMDKARDKLSSLKSSKSIIKMSSTAEQIKEAEKGGLRLVSFNDNLEEDGFEDAYDFVRGSEGGFSDHPNDRGGRTNFGVTQKTYNSYLRSNGQEKRDVADITEEEVRDIYRSFWDDVSGADLPYPLNTLVFDAAINSGPGTAAKQLQSVLGVERDGRIGPETIEAIEGSNIQRLAKDFLEVRKEFYEKLGDPDFIRGWRNRVKKLGRLVGGADDTRVA